MTLQKYDHLLESLLTDALPDLETATLNCALLADTHTPDTATHTTFTDVAGDEVTGDGYTGGGQAITSGVTRTGATATLDADGVTWPDSTLTAAHAVVYEASTELLIGIGTFDDPLESSDGELTVDFEDGYLVEFAPGA